MDQDITKTIPQYRRMLAILSPRRIDSSFYFNHTITLTKTLTWINNYNQKSPHKLTLLQLAMIALAKVLYERPQLNRYVSGHRFYQRHGVAISISLKKSLQDGAKIVLIKIPVVMNQTIAEILAKLETLLGEGKSDQDILQEKETRWLLRLPVFLIRALLKLVKILEHWHLLPSFFVDNDPFYASAIIANLGSVGLDAGYHHLFEHGNCPLFGVLGRMNHDDNNVPRVDIKWTFDERIDDGLSCALSLELFKKYLEGPELIYTSHDLNFGIL